MQLETATEVILDTAIVARMLAAKTTRLLLPEECRRTGYELKLLQQWNRTRYVLCHTRRKKNRN